MKQLNEFNTLDDAKTYFTVGSVTVNQAVSHDAKYSVEDIMDSTMSNVQASPELRRACKIFKRILTEGILPSINIGDDTAQDSLSLMVSTSDDICGYTQAMRNHLESFARVYPYANVTQQEFDESKDGGEVIALPDNNTQHKVTLAITKQPSKSTRIVIQQCFGNVEEDLTEWHDVGSVTVFYKQCTYSTGMIPAAPAPIRHLRAVSPLTLGVGLPEYPESTEI